MSTSCPRCGFAGSSLVEVCPKCWFAETEPDTEDVEVPGLVIESTIGRGGMGRVLRARHVRLEREVAVKVLAREVGDDPSFRARFEREARALGRLNHPQIVAVYDFGVTESGESYLVMEYVPGGTLAERIPLAPDAAIDVSLQICDALSAAHASGIVHRDLKPDNILFDAAGRVKLVDFGIARLLEAPPADALTQPFMVFGTPAYMAPEARSAAPPRPNLDVYAAGVLLREMLTGRPEPGARLPPAIEHVIARATRENPAERIETAAELRRLLEPLRRASAEPKSSLSPEDESWQRAAALLFAAATAVGLYAFATSFTPRVLDRDDALPLVMLGTRPLADGRLFTLARFETWPMLATAASFAVALAAYGVLRRHWRTSGIEVQTPERRIPTSNTVLALGLTLFGVGLVHFALEQAIVHRITPYMPVFGGIFEFVLLYLVWLTVLEARRTGRWLRREPRLWWGFGFGLVPPALSFFQTLAGVP